MPYILNAKKEVVQEPNYYAWFKWMSSSKEIRVLATHDINSRNKRVTTSFVGMDMSPDQSLLVFQTIVYDIKPVRVAGVFRFKTFEEALDEHKAICTRISVGDWKNEEKAT